jgi:hypothetical protein
MARNPDPTLKLTSSKGVSRTLDDWCTMFHLCLVVLPDRLEASVFVPIAQRIFATFGDADCRVAFLVTGNEYVADRILGATETHVLTFCDPDKAFVESLGLERLPAIVHLRQNTTVGAVAEGWDAQEWQAVVRELGKAMAWTVPEVSRAGDPPSYAGWPVTV